LRIFDLFIELVKLVCIVMNIYSIIIIAFISALYSCSSAKPDKKVPDKQSAVVSYLEGYVVKTSIVDQTITISGTLKSFEETILMPEVTGRVVKINLPEGKFVKAGTLLVKLYDADLQAQLHKSEAQLKITELMKERQSELMKVEGISQADYDQTALQVNSIKADIEVLKVQIRKTELLAPYDGVIGLRNISIGAQVTTSTALATIRAVKQLKLDFAVPEKYSGEIKTGAKVKFTVQGNEKKYDAAVIATEEGIDANTRNLKARALVNMNSSSLIPGAFANVELRLKEDKNALMVPTQAIIPQERNKRLIVANHGVAKFVTIKTGLRQASLIQVLNGIAPGDTVVTTGILFIKPGAKLKFSKVIK
jgi:membrane fusion protein, multidrug efflux system